MINRRYHVVFTILRPIFKLYLFLVYRYKGQPAPPIAANQPGLILANHNGAMDPFYLAVSFKQPIFFVASDHIFRLGWVSKIIRYLVNPIPIVKSQLDLRSLRQIRETIQQGGLVGLFPEGNRSFTGVTTYIPPATGKLVKQLNCPLIIYRMDGGYLTTPRWARHPRRGFFSGAVTRILKPAELKEMTPGQIYDLICQELHFNAFEVQKEHNVPYRGRKPAETLELVLFVCPNCRSLATLASRNDLFTCSHCHLSVRFNTMGFFEPLDQWSLHQKEQGLFLDTVAAWDEWQRQILPELLFKKDYLDLSGEAPLFTDNRQVLVLTERAQKSTVKGKGVLALYADRIEFRTTFDHNEKQMPFTFNLENISQMIIHGPKTLQFTTRDDAVWEIRSKERRSAYKYQLAFYLIQQRLKGEKHGFYSI